MSALDRARTQFVVMLVIAPVGMPLILVYTAFVYRRYAVTIPEEAHS